MQVRKQQLELDMEQQTVPNRERSTSRLVYCHPAYAGLDEAQAGIKTAGEISITSDMQMTPPLWQKVKMN